MVITTVRSQRNRVSLACPSFSQVVPSRLHQNQPPERYYTSGRVAQEKRVKEKREGSVSSLTSLCELELPGEDQVVEV